MTAIKAMLLPASLKSLNGSPQTILLLLFQAQYLKEY